jgi:flagellar assembly factor FliW
MDVLTRDYGIITVDVSSIIRFDEGILGFEEYHNYVLLDDNSGGGGGGSPFKCLQSLEESSLAFTLIDPFAVMADYEIALDDGLVASLGISDMEDVVVLSIVVVPEDASKASFNLKAPLVINARQRKGAQYIVGSDEYLVRHYILDELDKGKRASKNSA